jgi:type VI secretion system protein ImpK
MDAIDELTQDCFNALNQLREVDAVGSPETVHRRMAQLIDQIRERAPEIGVPERDAQDAGYALVALADEIAVSKPEPLRSMWMSRPLQYVYFNENRAGEGFFRRLQAIRGERKRRGVLRVYYLCLLFGFRGQYAIGGGELELLKLIEELRRDIEGDLEAPDDLSPRAEPPDKAITRRRDRKLFLWISLGALAAAIGLFVGMRLMLDKQVADTVDVVEQGGD